MFIPVFLGYMMHFTEKTKTLGLPCQFDEAAEFFNTRQHGNSVSDEFFRFEGTGVLSENNQGLFGDIA
jgi:hypothetical protein